jgi:hypothetical protein
VGGSYGEHAGEGEWVETESFTPQIQVAREDYLILIINKCRDRRPNAKIVGKRYCGRGKVDEVSKNLTGGWGWISMAEGAYTCWEEEAEGGAGDDGGLAREDRGKNSFCRGGAD